MNKTSGPSPGGQTSSGAGVLRHTRLIQRARKNPNWVLRDRRCAKPDFCHQFFEVCDDVALQQPREAVKYAAAAAVGEG